MSKTIEISNGPSREELFDGLRLFSEKRQVGFLIIDNGRQMTLPTIMQSIQAEDGSGQSWNISINVEIKDMLLLSLPINVRQLFAKHKSVGIKAYYSSKNRKGVITLE